MVPSAPGSSFVACYKMLEGEHEKQSAKILEEEGSQNTSRMLPVSVLFLSLLQHFV